MYRGVSSALHIRIKCHTLGVLPSLAFGTGRAGKEGNSSCETATPGRSLRRGLIYSRTTPSGAVRERQLVLPAKPSQVECTDVPCGIDVAVVLSLAV